MSFRTDFLFSNGSFLIGMGSVMNLGGNYYLFNASTSPREADARALASDFASVREDLKCAMEEVDAELSKSDE